MTSPQPTEKALGVNPIPGQTVLTRDGKKLGTIKECLGDAFKVDAPMKRDYWISFGSVLSISERGVELDFDEEQLEAFKLDDPAGGQESESPIVDAAQETFSSEAEIDARREANIHDGPTGLSGKL